MSQLQGVIRVRLTYEEQVEAHSVGFQRATDLASTASHTSRKDITLNYHEYISQLAEAVGSEMSVAKYFNLTDFKPTVNTFKSAADIGSRVEVKWTRYATGHLVIHHSDRIDDIAVLVVGRSPEYYLAGWIPIKDAKSKRYWRDSEQNWWISQNNLHPMDNFLRSTHATTAL